MTTKISWRWRQIAANPKWLLGYIPEIYPEYIPRSPYLDRNAQYDDLRPMLDWCDEHDIKVEYLTGGKLAFDSEEDLTLFLLRWS